MLIKVPRWLLGAVVAGSTVGYLVDKANRFTWAAVGALGALGIAYWNAQSEARIIEQVIASGQAYSEPVDDEGE